MWIEYQLALVLVHGMGLMALVSIAFGHIERLDIKPVVRQWLHGLAFGTAAVAAMLDQVRLGDGLYADGRAIIVGFAGAFGGIFVGLIAATLTAIFRLAQGGAGAVPGAIGVYAAAGLGYLWAILVKPSKRMGVLHLCLLGLSISGYLLIVFLLPVSIALPLFVRLWPILVTSAVICALIMGFFLVRETRLIEQERGLRKSAFTDTLTGLPNRRSFDDALARALKAAQPPECVSFALMMMDLDHFKRINDTYGHAAGDVVLRAVGLTLQNAVRPNDTVARLGGEEFAVILADGKNCRADLVAQRLREVIEALVTRFENKDLTVTVSVGLAYFRTDDDADSLRARADEALYRAKAQGRDRVVAAS